MPRWALGCTDLPAGKSIVVLGTDTRGNSSSRRYLAASFPSSSAPSVNKVSINTNVCSEVTSEDFYAPLFLWTSPRRAKATMRSRITFLDTFFVSSVSNSSPSECYVVESSSESRVFSAVSM